MYFNVPTNKFSLPEDFSLLKFLNDEVVKEEEVDHGSFGSICKVCIKGHTAAINEFFETNEMKWRKKASIIPM